MVDNNNTQAILVSDIRHLISELVDDESIAGALQQYDQQTGIARSRAALESILKKNGYSGDTEIIKP